MKCVTDSITRCPAPRAADVHVHVVRVAHESVAPSLEFAVKLVEHEIRQQGGQRTALRNAFVSPRSHQPVLHHPRSQESADEAEQARIRHALCHLTHHPVVTDSIEKLLQIEVHDVASPGSDVLLRSGYGVMSRAPGTKPVAVLGERRVPTAAAGLACTAC